MLSKILPTLATKSHLGFCAIAVRARSTITDSGKYVDPEGYYRERIGNRAIVGYGQNSEPQYVDRPDFPFPAIMYKLPSPDVQALQQKQKGDWRLLTLQEKKAIYRANFCQTFQEFQAPRGEWMYIVGMSLITISMGIWLWILVKTPLPKSFSAESVKAQLRRFLRFRINDITGLSSKWDYEKMCWKSKPWWMPFDDPFDDEEDDDYQNS